MNEYIIERRETTVTRLRVYRDTRTHALIAAETGSLSYVLGKEGVELVETFEESVPTIVTDGPRDGNEPNATGWTPCADALPAVTDERSADVLVTNGKEQWIACYSSPEDYEPRWVEKGRDAYYLDGITHWRPLSELPR